MLFAAFLPRTGFLIVQYRQCSMHRLFLPIFCLFLLWCHCHLVAQPVAAQVVFSPQTDAESEKSLSSREESKISDKPNTATRIKTSPENPLGGPKAAKASSEMPSQIRQAKPDLFYLPDEHGGLQAVPGFRFEDFEDLYRIKQGIQNQNQMPSYSLSAVSASGDVEQNLAKLTIDFDVAVHVDGWVGVRLRLDQAILYTEPKYDGPGIQSLHREPDVGSYVSWIRGKRGEKHRLTLKAKVPLTGIEQETQLHLSMPRATISELNLRVPLPNAIGTVTEGSTLTTIPSSEERNTTFRVIGLGGDFELTWRTSNGFHAKAPTVLESMGAIHSKIDDKNVNTKATLTLRSYGAAFDRFKVRLPKEAKLVRGHTKDYSLNPIFDSDSVSDENHSVVEVRLPKKTRGPVKISLVTTQSHEAGKSTDWIQLTGFEVIDAVRQWGHIAVEMAPDWRVLWGPRRGVRRIEKLPSVLEGKGQTIGFEYSGQPCSLMVRVVPRKTRISVEPEYVALVDTKQVRLMAKLNYKVRGAKAYALDIDLGDWALDTVGPGHLVASDAISVNESGVLSIPLAQPSIGRIAIEIEAYKIIPTGQKELNISLPRPHTNSLRPASVVVMAADNVELTPNGNLTTGLIRQRAAPQMSLPLRQQAPLFYRCETTNATFAASFSIHEQSITVNVETNVNLKHQTGEVRQRLSYTIAYEPADSLIVEVPKTLAELPLLEFELDGQTLSPVVLEGQDNVGGAVKMQIPLPTPRIGKCDLVVRYPIDIVDLLPETSITRNIPLVMPVGGELWRNRLYVSASPDLKVDLRSSQWKVSEGTIAGQKDLYSLQLFSVERTPNIDLSLSMGNQDSLGSTIASHVWIQTWLTQNARQDRAVFRFSSDQKEVELVVPWGVDIRKVELLFDGKQVKKRATPEGHLIIPLTNESGDSEHCLELQYNFSSPRLGYSPRLVDLPRLGRNAWVRRMYWQLVLPQNKHLIVTPPGLTQEFKWGWGGGFWGRQGLLEQRQLESWVGVQHRTMVPEATNRYLFGSFGPVRRCELRSVDRSLIVLVSSGLALAFGLLLIYVPITRHPVTILVGAIGLTAVGTLYPEPTLIVLQASCLGFGLALVAGLLERTMSKRHRAVVSPAFGSVNSSMEKGSTQTQYDVVCRNKLESNENSNSASSVSTSDSNL